jgi:hypothetical protein
MEELLIVILQFLFETVLESLLYWPFDTATDRMLTSRQVEDANKRFPLIVAAVAGGVVGAISLVVMPHTWLRAEALRIANLVLAPLISAGSAWLIASRRTHRHTQTPPREHAWFGFWFTLVFVVVRFIWCAR